MHRLTTPTEHTPPATPGTEPKDSALGTPIITRTPTVSSLQSSAESEAESYVSAKTCRSPVFTFRSNLQLTPPSTPGSEEKCSVGSVPSGLEVPQISPLSDGDNAKEYYNPFEVTSEKEVVLNNVEGTKTQATHHGEASALIKVSADADLPFRAGTSPASTIFHDVELQKAISDGSELAIRVGEVLAKCPMDSDLSCTKLQTEALAVSRHNLPVTRLIGVVGQSGNGKSSLINSLLDVEGLAITGEDGSAVTAFPIEYVHKTQEQASPFTVTASCLTVEQINEHLAELLEDYRKPFLDGKDEMTATEYEAAINRSKMARDTFEAAFSSMPSFKLQSLDYADDRDHQKSLALLRSWASALAWPSDMQASKWEGTADTAEQCATLVATFVDQGLWPFLKDLRVHLEAPILRDGLVLTDLPGYHDVNFARIRAARQYQSKCDEIIVVANIGRAITDPIIQNVLKEYKTSASGVGKMSCPSITVVCTHAADLTEEEKLEKFVDPRKLAQARAEQADINEKFFKGSDAKKAIRDADLRYKSLLMEARNAMIIAGLQNKYADYFAPEQLPVFCVDNYMYRSRFSLEAATISGIPTLREYCFGLMDKALFRAADLFLTSQLPALINSVELWIDAAKSTTEIDQGLLEIDSAHLQEALENIVNSWEDELKNEILSVIRKPLRRKVNDIIGRNLNTCASWYATHHSTYLAFIRNNGTHSTGAAKFRCWNTELIQNMNRYSAQGWHKLDDDAESGLERLCDASAACIVEFQGQAADAGAPNAFIRNLKARTRCLKQSQHYIIASFEDQLRRIKHNATSGHVASYVVDYMIPAYNQCKNDHGTGVTARNNGRLQDHVSQTACVTKQEAWATRDLLALVEHTATALVDCMRETVAAIDADLETIQMPPVKGEALFTQYPVYGGEVEAIFCQAKEKIVVIERVVQVKRTVAELKWT